MAETQATEVVEEYLETIYKLQSKEGEVAKTSDLTRSLKVVPGTVTNTIERLEKEGYVFHEPYRGVRLTEKGRNVALQVVRRHRLSERLLTDILHVDLSKAHEVACKIEHDIADEEIMEKIEEALGNPKTCPHGNPIPNEDGKLNEDEQVRELIPLMSLEVSDSAVVGRYAEDDPESLGRISSIGLKPGDEVEVVRREPNTGNVSVRLGHGATYVLSKKIAAGILVLKTRQPKRQAIRNHRERGSRILGAEFGEYES